MKNINKIILLVIAFFIIFVIMFFQKPPNLTTKKEFTNYEKIDINSGENVYTYKDYIYVYGKNGIKVYQNKEEVFSESFSTEDTYATFAQDKISIGDRNGKILKIFSSKGNLYSINHTNNIISSTVNKNGYSAIISKTNSFYEVLVFDGEGKKIFTLSNINYKEGIPIAVSISQDNSTLAVSFLKIDNAIMESNISIYSLNQTDTENNSVFGAFKKINQMAGIIKFFDNDNLLILSEQEFSIISVRAKYKDAKEIIKVPFKNKINFISFLGNNAFALGYGKPYFLNEQTNTPENTIIIYNSNGGKIAQISEQKNITNIYSNENGIVFCEDRLFKGYSPSGNKVFEYHAKQDIKSMQFFNSKDKAFIVTENDIKIFKINKKNIMNLQEKETQNNNKTESTTNKQDKTEPTTNKNKDDKTEPTTNKNNI